MKEYKSVVVSTDGPIKKLQPNIDTTLNEMASAGWELKFIKGVYFIFEREKN